LEVPVPIYSRLALRTEANQKLNDLYIGAVGSGPNIAMGASVFFLDNTQSDPSGSGQVQDLRAYIRHAGVTYRCASFNFASGAWVTAQLAATTVGSGDRFDVSKLLDPKQMDLCIDRTVSRLRMRFEVPLASTDGAQFYNIDSAASPQTIKTVLEAYYWASPTATANRDARRFRWYGTEQTATGMELRIDPPISGSLTIIMDAILDMTLGSTDAATLNFGHDSPIVWGAINQALDLVIQRAPGQEAGRYKERRQEAAAMWNALSAKFMPLVDRQIMFDENPFNKGVR
jgi:hypothetical protein